MKESDGVFLHTFDDEFSRTGHFKGVEINCTQRERGSQHADQMGSFKAIRIKLLEELVKNLKGRFPSVALFDAMQVCQLDYTINTVKRKKYICILTC